MKICVCIDKKNGMMFFGKRQSQDRIQRERMLEIIGDSKLWVSEYSAKLFEEKDNIIVDNGYITKAGDDDYCFIEDGEYDLSKCKTVILYKWNRLYPSDKGFEVDFKKHGLKKISKYDFAGSSHEKITEEIYERG